jgi:catechol 2,3-dioxygenase-like lactoylglutathione lyase family enzyme
MYLGGRGELVLVLDCSDLDRSAEFWTGVLGYVWSGAGGDTYRSLMPADGVGVELLLQRVADVKGAKNRLHLDLRTRDLASEVVRVCALGGVLLTDEPLLEAGWTWDVLADPDGNELCVLQPPADYWEYWDYAG